MPGGAESDDQHVEVLHPLARQLHRVQQRRHHDHGRPVLVVVEHRDVELLLQAVLDLEAARRRDVLQVDAAEGRCDQLDRLHDLVGIGGVQADRECVDFGELLEQAALALHHRHRRARPDVAEPEHRRAIGDDRDSVALDRVLKGPFGVVRDRQAHARNAGRVGHREVIARLQRMLVALFDLAADVQQERAVGRVDHVDATHRLDRRDDLRPVGLARGVHNHVTQAVVPVDLDEVDRADHPAGLGDRARQLPERAVRVVDPDANGESELCARRGAHETGLLGSWGQAC